MGPTQRRFYLLLTDTSNKSVCSTLVPHVYSMLLKLRRSQTSVVRCSSDTSDADPLSRSFARFVNENQLRSPVQPRFPTRLMPPTAVVSAQMDALQLNDWPEPDSGIQTAFRFTMPKDAKETMVAHRHARAWTAKEEWLDLQAFTSLLHSSPYSTLLHSDSWKAVSPLQFPSQRYRNKAVQAVEVQPQGGSGAGQALRRFTFCLEMVESGPYKECWLTVGVRLGDYTTS